VNQETKNLGRGTNKVRRGGVMHSGEGKPNREKTALEEEGPIEGKMLIFGGKRKEWVGA